MRNEKRRPPRLSVPGLCSALRLPHSTVVALARALTMLAVAGLVLGVYLGCNEETQYNTLSFFFDGVPAPGSPPPSKKTRGSMAVSPKQGTSEALQLAGGSLEETGKPAIVIVSEHEPYRNRDCFTCHQTESSMVAVKGDSSLCRKCHAVYVDPPADQWVHGPAALGMCTYCHEPHKSQYPSLLTAAPRDLCLQCHADANLLEQPYHKEVGEKACSTCHDPHMAGNRMLLVGAGTYQRRKQEQQPGSEHAPWKERQCTLCHAPERSNALVDNIDKVCLSCHSKVVEEAGGAKLHKAVLDGRCTACHTGHKSPRPNLLRLTAEQMCFTCHKPAEINKPEHPAVEHVDCLVCHKGHSSEFDHLLRNDWTRPAATSTNPMRPTPRVSLETLSTVKDQTTGPSP